MKKVVTLVFIFYSMISYALPKGFVYLDTYAPDISQDMRYATVHNFVGRPINGYKEGRCILTEDAARQLVQVQKALQQSGYGLKVYDCYRPKRAVEDFIAWSKIPDEQAMKAEFYPKTNKKDFPAYKNGNRKEIVKEGFFTQRKPS